RRGLAVETAYPVVVARPQVNRSDILDAHHAAVSPFADDDVAKLFGRRKPPLRAHRVSEGLASDVRFASDLPRRINSVLRLHCTKDFIDGYTELRQPIGFNPDAHRVLAYAEDLRLTYAVITGDRLLEVDIGVVGEKLCVVGAVRRIKSHE